jgi:glycosyltransferase involved in cell wall biosynthesis
MEVLLVAPSLDILGGQAVQASRIRKAMEGVPGVDLMFLPINPRLPRPLGWLKKIPYLRTFANFIHYLLLLLPRAARADLLHVFAASYWSYSLWTLPALLVGRLFGKKVILNYRDGQCADHMRTWRSALPTVRLAHAVVVPSGYLVDVFAEFGVSAREIRNFIDVTRFQWRERGPLRPEFMTNRILEPLYNISCILRAFRKIQDRYPEASLTIAHDGPLRESLEAEAGELKLANVRFLGRVPPAEVPALYNAAEIYLTTPNVDCMPGSLLECMASGLPIVATKAGGIPYIVQHEETALLVPLDDDEAVAHCCFRLLDDPQLGRRLAARGRQELARYTPVESRDRWVALYRELLA